MFARRAAAIAVAISRFLRASGEPVACQTLSTVPIVRHTIAGYSTFLQRVVVDEGVRVTVHNHATCVDRNIRWRTI